MKAIFIGTIALLVILVLSGAFWNEQGEQRDREDTRIRGQSRGQESRGDIQQRRLHFQSDRSPASRDPS